MFPDDVIGFLQDSQSKRWTQLEALLADETKTAVYGSGRARLQGGQGRLRDGSAIDLE